MMDENPLSARTCLCKNIMVIMQTVAVLTVKCEDVVNILPSILNPGMPQKKYVLKLCLIMMPAVF